MGRRLVSEVKHIPFLPVDESSHVMCEFVRLTFDPFMFFMFALPDPSNKKSCGDDEQRVVNMNKRDLAIDIGFLFAA